MVNKVGSGYHTSEVQEMIERDRLPRKGEGGGGMVFHISVSANQLHSFTQKRPSSHG